MIRDTFFDLHRFVNVCRKEMVESWKSNVLRMVLMYGMIAIALIWNAYLEYDIRDFNRNSVEMEEDVWTFGVVVFAWGIAIMGCLSASFVMERMKTKASRTVMLMTPATMFEKFFARWLVFTFGFLLLFFVAFKLADWTRVLFFMVRFPEWDCISSIPFCSYLIGGEGVEHWTLFTDNRHFLLGVSLYFMFQSFFVLGSTVWPRNAFLKTFASGFCIFIVYLLIGTSMARAFLSGDFFMSKAEIAMETIWMWLTVVASVMTLFNWVLAYFRFKESEIIHRW